MGGSSEISPARHIRNIATDLVTELPKHNGPWEEFPRENDGRHNLQWLISGNGQIGRRLFGFSDFDKTPLVYYPGSLLDKDGIEGWGREPDKKTHELHKHLETVLERIGFSLQKGWHNSSMTDYVGGARQYEAINGNDGLVLPDGGAWVLHRERLLVARTVYDKLQHGATLTGFVPIGFQISYQPPKE